MLLQNAKHCLNSLMTLFNSYLSSNAGWLQASLDFAFTNDSLQATLTQTLAYSYYLVL